MLGPPPPLRPTSVFSTKIVDFKGFDSSKILMLRGGLLMSTGGFPEMLSQQILAGIILAGRFGPIAS